jgi:HSP20 family protein
MILVELPGVPRQDLKVRIDGTRLTVSGEKPTRREGGSARVTERETGAFSREFLLPFQVRGEAIGAKLEDGVLTIDLPRAGTDGVKDITVG